MHSPASRVPKLLGVTLRFVKGHGTENDFVLLPDHDGTVHDDLGTAFVAALCDRRRGLGADGVMRVNEDRKSVV